VVLEDILGKIFVERRTRQSHYFSLYRRKYLKFPNPSSKRKWNLVSGAVLDVESGHSSAK